MSELATKTCPLCCESVHPNARKCPHCLHYLNKWCLAAYHPLFAMVPLMLMLAFVAYTSTRMFRRGADFNDYRSQISVVDSEMEFGESHTGATVAVVGAIRNESKIGWKDAVIEVQYFDKSHRLIDSEQRRDYSLALPPNGTFAFKVSQPREFDAAEYSSFATRVVTAKDAGAFLP